MSHDLFQSTAFALASLLYSWLCFRGGLFLRRKQHHHKDSRLVDYLGLSRPFDLEGWVIALLSGIGLGPFLPIIMAYLCWHGGEAFIFNWVGWGSIGIVGFLSVVWGLFLGKMYLKEYWKAIGSVTIEEVVARTAEFPNLEFSTFEEYVLDLAFSGIDSRRALAAARAGWWLS
jgi:hypothetical protein